MIPRRRPGLGAIRNAAFCLAAALISLTALEVALWSSWPWAVACGVLLALSLAAARWARVGSTTARLDVLAREPDCTCPDCRNPGRVHGPDQG
jgi:hypothetical protein